MIHAVILIMSCQSKKKNVADDINTILNIQEPEGLETFNILEIHIKQFHV